MHSFPSLIHSLMHAFIQEVGTSDKGCRAALLTVGTRNKNSGAALHKFVKRGRPCLDKQELRQNCSAIHEALKV